MFVQHLRKSGPSFYNTFLCFWPVGPGNIIGWMSVVDPWFWNSIGWILIWPRNLIGWLWFVAGVLLLSSRLSASLVDPSSLGSASDLFQLRVPKWDPSGPKLSLGFAWQLAKEQKRRRKQTKSLNLLMLSACFSFWVLQTDSFSFCTGQQREKIPFKKTFSFEQRGMNHGRNPVDWLWMKQLFMEMNCIDVIKIEPSGISI